ncbi:glycerol-3-phosphate dehydrogenase [Phaeobacter sp. J2-8]|uniref:glycerol-3-phosphate dehydrogenase n=1 Tax=Phaeobacter sp. J2-8 TaxID=2931394 RepID=UPI001FD33B16|nr:glycerol-3-phosphate dehydrogenase [Phaeobacter sp. J2-8]MCJ7873225.1 glycerol-3-phosphate dehydrogenase [Phaeobacter sp. J2-8]
MTEAQEVDLFVIGGGINGAGIARDAAGRGLRVALCEKDDLAEGTSSRSGKLIHGGLRYLEYYEFSLVRKALIEREVLLRNAPHIVWPMRFVLPHSKRDRPAWLVRLGLFLYDHLGGRAKLPGTRTLDLHRASEGHAIRDDFRRGFEYSDCWVDDARLVVLNALDAAERGATILTRSPCVSARREGGKWHVTTRHATTGETRDFRAHVLVNAAGPWVTDIITNVAAASSRRKVRLVKGSHIITPKFWRGEHAFLIQNHDKRVIFVNPYEGDKALIGTTDIAYDGPADQVQAGEDEIAYLIDAVNSYFKEQLSRDDVQTAYSGVRALFDDGQGNPSAVTRDYVLDLDETDGAPLLNIFGGKITTFRELSQKALQRLAPTFPALGGDWTAQAPLPGGDMDSADFDVFVNQMKTAYPWLPRPVLLHYARLYGTRMRHVVGAATSVSGLGRHFGGALYAAEAQYLRQQEWAQTAQDVLWRRTKHLLHLTQAEQAEFTRWFEDHAGEGGLVTGGPRPVERLRSSGTG